MFNDIRSLKEEAKGDVCSLTDEVGMKTVLDVLREKHPEQSKAKLNYPGNNEHPTNLPHHQSIFKKLNASMMRNFAMKTRGSHDSSGLDANE